MKKYTVKSLIISVLITSGLLTACTDLDTPVVSEITPDNFPKTAEDFIAVAGPIYTRMSADYMLSYWFNQECSADGMVLTANGGNWYDSGRYADQHYHNWKKDERFVGEAWRMCFNGISKCNSVLQLFEKAEESAAKKTAIAEIRAMRALNYFMVMDLYGDVPLVTSFGNDTQPGARVSRATISDFIETELKTVLPDLSGTTGATTYGRPTKWMAYTLLAKLYINAPVYTGKSRNDEVVAMCDKVITEAQTNGTISLDADYLKMFYPDNGPSVKDFIFAVVYDCNNMLYNYPARYWLNKMQKTQFGTLPFTPAGCMKTWPEFYAKFTIDNTDVRQKMWLTGKQYLASDGITPIAVVATKKQIDSRYTGVDASTKVTYQLEFTPNIEFRNLATFDTGDDYAGLAVGYRCNKFYPDIKSATRDQSNDVPVFRYADVLLMKAEAILRGASPTMSQTALSLVNLVRTRAKASQFTSIDLNGLLDERARELCFECWRRNDLIRFGKWEDKWGVKTDADVHHRVFPIPSTEIDLNPLMTQNPGY